MEPLFATHNRAGEITYTHLSGFRYRITVTTYTKISAPADRDTLSLSWGDGSGTFAINRTLIDDNTFGARDIRRNTYVAEHTYPGAGNYVVSITDPNRNSGVLNMKPPNMDSDQVSFYLQSLLIINPFAPEEVGPHNNSAILLNAPVDIACFQEIYEHNPGAYDIDGDSLVYSIVPSRMAGGVIPDFFKYPDEISPGANNNMTINSETGELIWESPQRIGEYNMAILIEEYRNGFLVGATLRDMQIEVKACDNQPPMLIHAANRCVFGNDTLREKITGTDPNINQSVNITAVGEPFFITPNAATLVETDDGNPAEFLFEWPTLCKDVREKEYTVNYKAEDSHPTTPLVDFSDYFIKVIGPPIQNVQVTRILNNNKISWDNYTCANEIDSIKLYRRKGNSGYIPNECETGLPDNLGFELLAAFDDVNTTQYTDNDVEIGSEYCYILIACFKNNSESQASEEVCNFIPDNRPYVSKVSVGVTDVVNGIDTISWENPIDTLTNYNSNENYRYELYWLTPNRTLIYTSPTAESYAELNRNFIHQNQDTKSNENNYLVELIKTENANIDTTSSGSSTNIFLNGTVADKQVNLTWSSNTAWSDTLYYLYYKAPGQTNFSILNQDFAPNYLHSNLENETEHCYYVVGYGKFQNPLALTSTINYSQQICLTPTDNQAPCAPNTSILENCEVQQLDVRISLNDCNNDAKTALLYKIDPETNLSALVDSFEVSSTNYAYQDLSNGIKGCYYITLLDSNRNESSKSQTFCNEGCGNYTLPNVFTPNGDGTNDLFKPFPYTGVEEIDIKILNRWGKLVFETDDPDINWDGNYMGSGDPCGEGTFYYVINLKLNSSEGVIDETIQGFFTLIRD